eukprot:8048093-Karenia_brevis.AAC.1
MPQLPKAIRLGPAPGPPAKAEPQPKKDAPEPRLRLELPQMARGSCTAQTALALSNIRYTARCRKPNSV